MRHCIIAVVWDERDSTASEAEEALRDKHRHFIATGKLNPFCGLCKSEVFHCEKRVTGWATVQEATPHLQRSEREQALTALAAELIKRYAN